MGLYLKLILLLVVVAFFGARAEAKKLLILHTNDLHAFLSSTVQHKDRGGYATIKTMIEQERQKALAQGMEVLVLDAGDFLEGSLYYMANDSRRTFEIMNLMGYDAVAVGNHDWLMGTSGLNELLRDVPPKFRYLGANFKVKKKNKYKSINHYVEDYFVKNIHGMKVAIMGVTTDELFYSWRFYDGKIYDPVKITKKLSKKIKKEEKADFIISLNHTGFWKDKKIVSESEHLDFIVGGHSHTKLHKVHYEKNKKGRAVGIVQAGEHGNYLGRLVLDLEKGKPLKVLEYRLMPVIKSKTNENSRIKDYIDKTDEILGAEYGRDWLDEIIGDSKVDLNSYADRLTYWTAFIADATREAVNADVSVHAPNLTGTGLSKGLISREDLINSYPRFFDLKDKQGWKVYTAEIYGAMLKSLLRASLKFQRALVFSGASFDLVDRDNNPYVIDLNFIGHDTENPMTDVEQWLNNYLGVSGKYRVTNLLVNGEPIIATKKYTIAIPEGLVVGGMGISGSVNHLLKKMKKTEVTMWQALEEKIQATGTLGTEIGPWSGQTKNKGLSSLERGQNYTFIPSRL